MRVDPVDAVEHLLQGVERARADVAEDDAERAERQRCGARLRMVGGGLVAAELARWAALPMETLSQEWSRGRAPGDRRLSVDGFGRGAWIGRKAIVAFVSGATRS